MNTYKVTNDRINTLRAERDHYRKEAENAVAALQEVLREQGVNMASRIAELEQTIASAKVAAGQMYKDAEKGDFKLPELARHDLQAVINALWNDPDGKLWDEAETERQRRAGWEGLFAQQGVTDEQCDAIQVGTVVLGELVMHSWGLVPVNEPIADTGDVNIVWHVIEYHMGDKTVIKGVGYSPEEAMHAALHSEEEAK